MQIEDKLPRAIVGITLTIALIGLPLLSQVVVELRTNKDPGYVPGVVGKLVIGMGLDESVVRGTSVRVVQSIRYWLGFPTGDEYESELVDTPEQTDAIETELIEGN